MLRCSFCGFAVALIGRSVAVRPSAETGVGATFQVSSTGTLIQGSDHSIGSRASDHSDEGYEPVAVAEDQSNILYVVRTCDATVQARLPAIMETWAGPVKESLLIVGDSKSDSPKVHSVPGCGKDHWFGLTCKTGQALALAASMIGSHEWVFVTDDDVYVNTTHLETVLRRYDFSESQALGISGCADGKCKDGKGGFCGGGGYALSQAALRALVDKPDRQEFSKELLAKASEVFPKQAPYDDIVVTCLMKQHGVKISQLGGLYGWRLDNQFADPGDPHSAPQHPAKLAENYTRAIHTADPPPITFHYVVPAEMYLIHSEFGKASPAASSAVALGSTISYEDQLHQYLLVRNREFRIQAAKV